MLTTQQYRDLIKTETRRLGWLKAKVGDQYMGVVKSQGLKKGEHVVKLHPMQVVKVWREPLRNITKDACRREGFPDKTPAEFIIMFSEHNKAKLRKHGYMVTVIRFKHLALCPGCLYQVAHAGDYCGECLCEEDGV